MNKYPGVSKTELYFMIIVLIMSRAVAYALFPVFDDAFITFRYAHNLANGDGFIYNLGEWVLGTTSPLFGLFSALFFIFGGTPETWIPWLNISLDIVLLLLGWRFLFQEQKAAFILFWMFFSLSPMLARISVGGMEANLFSVVTVSAFALYNTNRPRTASAVAAVSYFLRPEGVLTVAVLCLWELFGHRQVRRAIILGVIAICTVAPVLAAIFMMYGSFLPQSVIAKSHHVPVPPLSVLQQLLAPEPISAIFSVIGVISLYVAARRNTLLGMLVLWFVFYVSAYTFAGPKIWSWYSFTPLLFAAAFAAQGLSMSLSRTLSLYWGRIAPYAVYAASGIVTVAWIFIGITLYPDRITQNVYRPIKVYCRDHVTFSDTIMASDIGAIGYYCPSFIYDTAALVWPTALQYKSPWDIVTEFKPTYLFLNVGSTTLKKMASPPFDCEYQPLIRFPADGISNPTQIVNLTDTWTQEYVLYKRTP